MTDQVRTTTAAATKAGRPFTRKEVKAITRSRLLEAALAILDEEGEAALTTINVTRRAGIAQSSFYVHFADMDDLLHSLIDELSLERLRLTREARRGSRSAPWDMERFRDTFRVPITHSIAHPRLFRLLIRSRHDPASPLGEWSRSVFDENRAALVEDLVSLGMPNGSDADRRRLEMIADGVIALTESMMLGHIEGRYPDIEEAIDVLITFSEGYLRLREQDAARRSRAGGTEDCDEPA
ncbi:TetR family transcriptional regulator [Pseudonocardia nigra]|uniref:TetR family transcriptional regulator n=1 Tax=Pseudonocardia nigra TaxID=1921578 RepID=UPI001C5D78C2|nr:TetR family transcriptional regulator [Pseudonocardia nigra]